MPWKTIVCTREELYEQVWSTPVKELAKAYGVSDVGLAKVCRKLRVPKPGRGYWQRREAGQEIEREPLPPAEDGQPLDHEIRQWEDPGGGAIGEEAAALLAREQEPSMAMTVPEQLRRPHPLIQASARILRNTRGDWQSLGRLQKGCACLDVKARGDTLERALRIIDTLLKALERRGFDVRVTKPEESYIRSKTEVRILGMWVGFSLKESANAVKVESSSRFWRHTDYHRNGKLTLKIERWGNGTRRSWADGKTQRLEDLLGDFVCNLIVAAEQARVAHLEYQRREQLCREEEERRREAARLRAIEAHRVHDLQSRLTDWQQAHQLREFIAAVERNARASERDVSPESDLGRWLTWARKHADAVEADAIDNVLELRPLPSPPRRPMW